MTKAKRPSRIRIRHRGPVFHFFWPLTRYLVSNFSAAVGHIYFMMINRTIIIGRENVGEKKNTVLLPNHQSMIDGFLVGAAVFFPRSLLRPNLLPWLPAAYENFFTHPVMRWLSDNWKCIPVKQGRKDFGAMKRMEACLQQGMMIVFPEGTRSRDGELLPPRSGIGYVMLRTRPKAVPVCLDGMDRVLPVGAVFPRIFQTIYIWYGEAADLSEFYDVRPGKDTAKATIEEAFAHVKRMQGILQRYRRYRRYVLAKKPFFYRFYRP
ncbi:MAG: lysophospholipid acyltransferase family protein [Elusimicrobiota bacterium]